MLRELVHYDPATGVVTDRATGVELGSPRGGRDGDHYVGVRIDGRSYYAHRVAVAYMTGAWPSQLVDHRDTHKRNNRWLNLRPATHGQNNMNTKAYKNNQSGLKGVCKHVSGLFGARI